MGCSTSSMENSNQNSKSTSGCHSSLNSNVALHDDLESDDQSEEDESSSSSEEEAIYADDGGSLLNMDDIDDSDEIAAPSTATSNNKDEGPFKGLGKLLEPYSLLAEPIDVLQEHNGRLRVALKNYRTQKEVYPRDSGLFFCRICRETEDTKEQFVSPCKCRGTVEQVHLSCLERWLAESDSSRCELCGHEYHTVRTPRYNLLASIPVWMCNTGSSDLLFDIVAFGAFTPVALLGTYLGFTAAENAYLQVSLMAAIDVVYSAWVIIRLQTHIMQWYSWWRRKSDVKIILEESQTQCERRRGQDSDKT